MIPFGYDWLGRYFAVDFGRMKDNQPLILLLEPGAGEAMQIPAPVTEFHNETLVELANDALALSFYKEWKEINPDDIQPDQCVGYKVPLFLNGADDIDNLELSDLSVYIEICGQLRNKVKSG